ncbi:MAG TPA: extracellular solute-binding protein [Galbitalea sp.]|jgi:iron(III) transport system substrate-binding protein
MKRKFPRLVASSAAVITVAVLLAACSSGTPASKTTASASSGPNLSGTSLTWYSTIQAQDAQPIIDAFKAKTGVTVNLYTAATPDLFQKFEQEEASGRHTASVFSTTNGTNVRAATDEGYFSPLPASIAKTFPKADIDPANKWFATRVTVMAFAYNSQLVTGSNVPKTWTDLLKPYWKGKLNITDPQLTTTGYFIDWQLSQAKGLGLSFLKKLGAQKPAIVAHSGQQVNNVIAGDEYAAITSDDAVWPEIATGAPIKMVYPSKGVGDYTDYNSLVKGGPNQAGAKAFLEFLASETTGKLFAAGGAYSPLPSVAAAPAGRPALKSLNLFPADTIKALDVQTQFLNQLQQYGLATTTQ